MRREWQQEVAAYEASWSKYSPWSSRFYERGIIEQKKKDSEAAKTYAESLGAHEIALRSMLQRSQTSLNEATTSFRESQALREEANTALERARARYRKQKGGGTNGSRKSERAYRSFA